ncbi:uncharacterized protein KY384_003113 [Bacidia gigantensis]|uniref:uncharacterized protein n=1 Tax=Bacidia gigantensis TaxID=2732470 RepID=UPI001D045DFF|nr:uncharacterized protein KY384_003113 [Bacidia gigantensis]KAG8531484.1 hypothetical protein KY384_003113 [Bacidia gigantensis]
MDQPVSSVSHMAESEIAPSAPKPLDNCSSEARTAPPTDTAKESDSRAGFAGRRGGKKRDMGRKEWSRNPVDKRARNTQTQRSVKRLRIDGEERGLPVYATKYTEDEIAKQERRPKRKVAVMIGYSGTGYKGMQLSNEEKTIEGDLFRAFVEAGAISKANADDPKKSSLVRCARTDKGVHAAGNVISLKLIIEDDDVVSKINEALSPQIRVWGIERTNSSFSAYQMCDSRVYEYLIPSYCFLPPHPKSFLGEQILKIAEEEDDLEGYRQRQEDVANFWKEIAEQHVKQAVETLDNSLQDEVLNLFHSQYAARHTLGQSVGTDRSLNSQAPSDELTPKTKSLPLQTEIPEKRYNHDHSTSNPHPEPPTIESSSQASNDANTRSEFVLRTLRAAINVAKRTYRIPSSRIAKIRSTLSRYVGSHRFHNYTVDKTARDPSAVRIIKSFTVDSDPIIIGGTEWLSLKVHGQSFMMHQIRKMVSAVALVVRCGCHEGRIQDTYLPDKLSIPKAPSLGLLLERPVFDKQNEKMTEYGRGSVDFEKYKVEMAEFKQREIYDRIFQVEEREGMFLAYFAGLDSTRSSSLFWAGSAGVRGIKRDIGNNGGDDPQGKERPSYEEEDEHGAQEDN